MTNEDRDKLYRYACPNGHEYISTEPFSIKFFTQDPDTGEPILSSYVDVCPYCYLDWIGSHVAEAKNVGEVDPEELD